MQNMFIEFSNSRRIAESPNGYTQRAHVSIQTLNVHKTLNPLLKYPNYKKFRKTVNFSLPISLFFYANHGICGSVFLSRKLYNSS